MFSVIFCLETNKKVLNTIFINEVKDNILKIGIDTFSI